MATQEHASGAKDIMSRISEARTFFLENGGRGAPPPDMYKRVRWTMCGW